MPKTNVVRKQAIDTNVINSGTKPTTSAVPAKLTKTEEGKRKVVDIALTKEQQKAFSEQMTLSSKIRYLNSQKFSTGQIAKFLSGTEKRTIRYQHVRNVLVTPMKRAKA